MTEYHSNLWRTAQLAQTSAVLRTLVTAAARQLGAADGDALLWGVAGDPRVYEQITVSADKDVDTSLREIMTDEVAAGTLDAAVIDSVEYHSGVNVDPNPGEV